MTGMEMWLIVGLVWVVCGYVALIVILAFMLMTGRLLSTMGGRLLAINPMPNRRMELLKLDGEELAYSKKRGYFFVNPEHVYVEHRSGKPIVIAPSILGKTVDPKKIQFIDSLKDLGIRNYDDLLEFIGDEEGKEKTIKVKVEREVGEGKNKKKQLIEEEMKAGDLLAHIGGQSISLGELVDYFSEQMPADLQESKIQHRVTVETIKNKKRDIALYVVLLAIIMVAGAVAFAMVSSVGNNAGTQVDPNAITSAIESGLAKSQTKVIMQNTSTALG